MRRVIFGVALFVVFASPAEAAKGKGAGHGRRDDPLAEVRHEAQWIDVAPAPIPSGLPLLEVGRPDTTGSATPPVDRPALRSLLVNRRFKQLTKVLEKFQAAFEADARREDWMSDAYDVLGYAHERERELIEAWIAATPRSFAPYLARAAYWKRSGFLWRGSRLGRDTSGFELASMREAFARARRDVKKALALRPGLVEARALLISVDVADGDQRSAAKAMEEALRRCPSCYHVRTEWLWALEPRWGGSLAEMEEFATRRIDEASPRHRSLRGYVDLERAREALENGNGTEALALLDRACTLGGDWLFFVSRADANGWSNLDTYLADLERANSIQPGLSDILSRRASALARAERWEEAGRDLLVVLQSRPTSLIGNRLQPSVVRALDALAWKQHQAGRSASAARLYELARALAPTDEQLARRAETVARARAAVGPSPAEAAPASGDARPELKLIVLDGSGRPVPAARIVLEPGRGNWEQLVRMASVEPAPRADDQGRFIVPVPVGPWIAMAFHPSEPLAGVAAPVAVTTTGAEARLAIGGALRIEGRVVDASYRPAAGIEVRAIPDTDHLGPEPRGLAAAISRDDGAFTIVGVDSGRYRLFAHGRGQRGPMEQPSLGSAAVGGDGSVVIRVQKERALRGRVLIATPGGATAVAQTFKVTANAFGEHELQALDGRFSIEFASSEVKARAAFSVDGRPPIVRTIDLSEEASDVGDVVIGPGRLLRGRVVGANGAPVAGARLNLEMGVPIARTVADGGFEATVPDGPFVLEIQHERWLGSVREVKGDEEWVDVRLNAGARLKVLATGPSGSPITGAVLTALSGAGRPRGCETDATGRCEIAGLEPAEYWIVSHGGNGLDPNAPVPAALHLRVGAGDERGVPFRWLHEPTRLTVHVVDQKGIPVPSGARLFPGTPSVAEAMEPNGVPRIPFYDAPGQGALENLPPGKYTAIALGIWGMPACAATTVDVRPGGDQELTLTLGNTGCR